MADQIRVLLVDDIADTRENIKKLLSFEPDMEVVGTAATGREAVEITKELKPDIIIMDINMPDMDGLQATSLITKAVPTAAVIIMSVQDDSDYMRRAMLAGARDFLAKPVNMDELYNTIRTVYRSHEPIRLQYKNAMMATPAEALRAASAAVGGRGGHIIAVYSPQGGAGTTTIATNIASGLMREGVKVLLIDADWQFGDVATFLNVQSQTTITDVLDEADDVDVEHFDHILTTHESGLKVLLGPARPEFAEEVLNRAEAPGKIIRAVASNYDFIIIDTGTAIEPALLGLLDAAEKIVLVGTASLPGVKNMRYVLDLFDQLGYAPDKTMLVLNKAYDERQRKNAVLAPERIENFLKRRIEAQIPNVDERIILSAILKGVPLIAFERDRSKSPVKEIMDIADNLYRSMMGDDHDEVQEKDTKKRGGLGLRLGGR